MSSPLASSPFLSTSAPSAGKYPSFTLTRPRSYKQTMASTYLSLVLSCDHPIDTLFSSPDGQKLFSTRTKGRTTTIRRLYGRTANKTRTSSSSDTSDDEEEGLVIAEIEWMERTRSSRIRFPTGRLSEMIDVRIDEFMKGTSNGGKSKMFAGRDGRVFKWKTSEHTPAQLYQYTNGRRVSDTLAKFVPSVPLPDVLVTPPSPYTSSEPGTPLTPNSDVTSPPYTPDTFGTPSFSTFHQSFEAQKARMYVHKDAHSVLDQVMLTWVVMEWDRRCSGRPLTNLSY